MVFTDGTPASLRAILGVFDEFAQISGLAISISKSTLFAAGRGKARLESEAVAIGLSVSTLPIHYLGLPLPTRSMTIIDYELFIDKIRT